MDEEILGKVLNSLGVDLWSLIDSAISVAVRDHGNELKLRRDGIVEQLYSRVVDEKGKRASPSMTSSQEREDDGGEDTEEEMEDEEIKILAIKEHLEDPDQSEESLVQMLQALADMDIKFKILQATDIGRQVNGLRKHQSAEVRRLVKHLVRKWKEMVDDWVKKSSLEAAMEGEGEVSEQIHDDSRGDKNQIPDFGLSPIIQPSEREVNWSSKRNNKEAEAKPMVAPLRKEAPTPPTPPLFIRSAPSKEPKDSLGDPEKLASARRRLHENYQEAENAKKQRTIQVMDIHDVPRPKNSFLRRDHKVQPGKRK